jgi:Protein of unknown function (DUF2793)
MPDQTSRHGLPLLASGQAQKEITHNEALLLLDALAHPAIESRTMAVPPAAPLPGQLWLVAASASGDWAGRTDQLALWTLAGWRFLAPQPGLMLWSKPDNGYIHFGNSSWQSAGWSVSKLFVAGQPVVSARQPAIAAPTGGGTIDAQARTAISSILAALRTHGLIET